MSPTIDEALGKADEIASKIKEFFDGVNSLLDWVPGALEHLIQPIIDGLNRLNQKMTEFWEKIKEFLDNTGNPSKLERFAEEWRNSIGNPTGDIAGNIALEKLATNTEWTGSGAEAYKALIPSQADGLNGIKDISIQFAETLKSLANGIENFWISMGIAFGSLVVGLAAAIVEACTVVAVPAAIITAIGAIGVAIGFIGAAIVAFKGIYDTIDTSQDKIDQALVDLGDSWSKATPGNQKKIDDEQQWEPL